jgi:putative ABC transport system permease protein
MNKSYGPPKYFHRFFRWFCHPKLRDHIEGDLLECYNEQEKEFGKRKADLKFIIDVLLLVRPGIIKPAYGYRNLNSYGMYKNYFVIAWRNLLRNKGYSFINIGGLALAMACSTAIILYVENELNFDRFHHDSEQVYRVVKDFVNEDGTKIPDATTPPALARALREELPEVENSTRFVQNRGRLYLLQYHEQRFYETRLLRVDNRFFEVFDFPFLSGNKHSALKEIHSVILTETTAKKYFGSEDPINKVIQMNLNGGTDFIVSGVLKDVPQNSHFTFDLIIPFESRTDPDTNWEFNGFYTYVRLRSGSSPDVFESNVKSVFKKHKPISTDQYHIQPLEDIHLYSKLKLELSENGDSLNVKIMIAIGLFVILIASINYINLVTAQSSKRAKEIGVRKISGANKGLLMQQLLTESVLTALLSLVISIVLTLFFLPLIKPIISSDLSSLLYSSKYVRLLPWFAMAIGIAAGLYPAFYLSGFEPLKGLKGSLLNSPEGARFRQGLVVFQFVISSSMVIGALVIIQQLDFMKKKNLGFDKDNILLLPNVRGGIGSPVSDPAPMIEELKRIPGITHIARADGVLGFNNSTNGVGTKNNDNHIALNFIRSDYEFLPTLQIKVREGRNFSEQFKSDSSAIILNEKAIEQLGLKKPYIGQSLAWDDEEGKTHDVVLIGIVENFHFNTLRETIKPFGFILEVGNGSTFFLKMNSLHVDQTIASVEKIWIKHNPEKPFEYSFQDERFAKLHLAEVRFQNLFSMFTVLAILITCLGIFGLITYLAGSKTKEIGIRKVLGSSVNAIVILLSKDFLKMTMISFVISFPLSYYLMDSWLQSFAYRSAIGWSVFVITVVASLCIVSFTVSFQAIKAALANPVNSLRSE